MDLTERMNYSIHKANEKDDGPTMPPLPEDALANAVRDFLRCYDQRTETTDAGATRKEWDTFSGMALNDAERKLRKLIDNG